MDRWTLGSTRNGDLAKLNWLNEFEILKKGESSMNTQSKLHQTLQALLITVISIFALAPAYAADPLKVTADNYVRAESDFQMRGYIKGFNCFGKFHHSRKPYDVENQVTVRGNRDTLYSFGVFDLRSPVTITLPETRGRYQSLMIVNQDHSIWGLYGPKKGTLTEENVGTRYVFLLIRTFADPNDDKDMKAAYRLQDAVGVEQADIGRFEVPNWKKEEVERMRDTINVVASTVTDSSKMFGKKEELDPVYWLLGAALGWGGLPAADATYVNVFPEKNDGKTLLVAGRRTRLGGTAGSGRHVRERVPRKERRQDSLYTHRKGRAG
jgi:hypothetical protein